jgi:tetratricopeptide (TPR) repeat protein
MADDLAELFYLGFYTKVSNAPSSVLKNEEGLEFLWHRSRLALGQIDAVISACRSGSNTAQKSCALLAEAFKSPDSIPDILSRRDPDLLRTSPLYAIALAIIYLRTDSYPEALEVLDNVTHPEAASLRIQALLGLNRVDLAKQQLSNVTHLTLEKLARGYIALYEDREQVQRTVNDFLDLRDRFRSYGTSALLENAIAVCLFATGDWDSGYETVKAIAEQFPNDETTAINLAVGLCHNSNKFDEIDRQIQLVQSFKSNKYTRKLEELLQEFDETAAAPA